MRIRPQHALLIALAIPFAGGVAHAAEDTPAAARGWLCELCSADTNWYWDADAGPAYVTDDAYNFGDFTGLDEKGTYLFSDFYGRYLGEESNYVVFEGYTRSEDALAVFIKGGKQSAYELRGSYQAVPRRLFNTAATPYIGNNSDTLTLPGSWVRAPNTAGMTDLASSLAPVKIENDLSIWKLGFDIEPGTRWLFRTDYSRREQSGNNRYAGAFLFSAVEFVKPTEYTTDNLELELAYSADTWQTSLRYYGSRFENQYESLTWDNPYTSSAGADAGQLALPPDNDSHQLALAGSMLLPARTTLSGQLSAGRLRQNEALLPFTTNPGLAAPLPVQSADTEVDTVNLNLRAVSSPWRKVTIEGELRYNDFDNKTPVSTYNYVITDSLPANNAVTNTTYDYERSDIKLRGEYRLTGKTRLHAGFDTEQFKRSDQARNRTTTNRLWFRMNSRVGRSARVDLDLFTEDRGGSEYADSNPAAPQNPLMRKYNMADRERRGIKLRGTMFAGERTDFSWEAEWANDDYNNSAIGLTESDYLRLGADFSWLLTDSATAYLSLYNEDVTAEQANSQSFSSPDWTATSDDTFTTATLGANWPELIGKVGAKFEYIWSQSVGEIRNNTSGLPSTFPDLRTKRRNVTLGLDYPYSDSLGFGLDYIYEKFSSSDWHLDGVEPATVGNLLSLGADAWNYDTSVVYLNFRYQTN